MSERNTYTVHAYRDGSWWALEAPEVRGAFSQARRLDQADEMIRDAISLLLDVEPDSFDVDIQPDLGGDLAEWLSRFKEARSEQARINEEVRRDQVILIEGLYREGLTQRDIGVIVGLSHQRVGQIMGDREELADA